MPVASCLTSTCAPPRASVRIRSLRRLQCPTLKISPFGRVLARARGFALRHRAERLPRRSRKTSPFRTQDYFRRRRTTETNSKCLLSRRRLRAPSKRSYSARIRLTKARPRRAGNRGGGNTQESSRAQCAISKGSLHRSPGQLSKGSVQAQSQGPLSSGHRSLAPLPKPDLRPR